MANGLETLLGQWIGNIFGGFIASLIAIIIWEFLKSPKLSIRAIKQPEIQNLVIGKRGLYHLEVINKGYTTAYECEANVTFKNMQGEELFHLKGKWTRSPEPVIPIAKVSERQTPEQTYEVESMPRITEEEVESHEQEFPFYEIETDIENYPYPSLVPAGEIINIRPSISEEFAFLIKIDGQEECYGFSGWSYILGDERLQVSEWKLGLGSYLIDVKVKGSNAEEKSRFRLKNNGRKLQDIKISD